MRPFVPAMDFDVSYRFYTALGFDPLWLGEGLASMQLGPYAFLLQDFYVKEWAENCMMHVLVQDLDAWWTRIAGLNLGERFEVKPPAEPTLQPWGQVVSYVWDPAGVLWHFAQDPHSVQPG